MALVAAEPAGAGIDARQQRAVASPAGETGQGCYGRRCALSLPGFGVCSSPAGGDQSLSGWPGTRPRKQAAVF